MEGVVVDGDADSLEIGRIFAYKSISFLSCTIGDEYPATLREGELQQHTHIHVKSLG